MKHTLTLEWFDSHQFNEFLPEQTAQSWQETKKDTERVQWGGRPLRHPLWIYCQCTLTQSKERQYVDPLYPIMAFEYLKYIFHSTDISGRGSHRMSTRPPTPRA